MHNVSWKTKGGVNIRFRLVAILAILVLLISISYYSLVISRNNNDLNASEEPFIFPYPTDSNFSVPFRANRGPFIILNELDIVTIQIVPFSNNIYWETPIFYSLSVYNKSGLQLYQDAILPNSTILPYNITIQIPPEPPYLFMVQTSESAMWYGDFKEAYFNGLSDLVTIRHNFTIESNQPNTTVSKTFKMNETTIAWNFIGLDDQKNFYGNLSIIDSRGMRQIFFNRNESIWIYDLNQGARFPVRGQWEIRLETREQRNVSVGFPLLFSYFPEDAWEKFGFDIN